MQINLNNNFKCFIFRYMFNLISDDEEANEPDDNDLNDSKIGAKKRAKLEAKAEKKAQREVIFLNCNIS